MIEAFSVSPADSLCAANRQMLLLRLMTVDVTTSSVTLHLDLPTRVAASVVRLDFQDDCVCSNVHVLAHPKGR